MTAPRSTTGADRGIGAHLRWIRADLVPGRFFEGPEVLRRVAPFVAAGLLPFALLPFADGSLTDPRILAAAALVAAMITAAFTIPWSRLPMWVQAIPPLAYFPVVALLHDASPGALSPWYPLVALVPAWFALYGTRGELAVSALAQGALLALFVWPLGGAEDTAAQLALAAATVLVTWTVGGRIQGIVGEMRRIAGESRAILNGVDEAFIAVDEDCIVHEWNAQAERTFGWSRDEMIGADLVEHATPPEHRGRVRDAIAEFLTHGHSRLMDGRTEARAMRRDGTIFPVEMTVSSQLVGGRWVFNVLVHDIDKRKRTEGALSEAEERFRRAFEDIGVGMAIVSTDGVFLSVNAALGELTGYPNGELIGRRFADISHPDDVETDLNALAEIVDGERYAYRTEKRYLHASGQPVWIALIVAPIHDDRGDVVHMISQMEDITERKQAEAKLTHQALHDPLTGLPNRVLFADRVRMAGARRDGGNLAVIYLDLDTFKPVNDTLGHAVGDRVLIEVARRLERLLREGDTLARLGGDEFAILCEDVDDAEAQKVAGRVIEALDRPFMIDDLELRQAASVGVAVRRRGRRGVNAEEILRDADRAMYKAKAAGKSRYAVYEGWMGGSDDSQEELERDLREGIGTGQLRVHYQPEIDLQTGAVTGAEALVRWEHPERGLLEPSQFMFIAQATGLIAEIDDFVLRQACHQAARWREEMEADEQFTVSVNLSEHRLADPGLSGQIAQAIADSQLPPASLCLEIAERSVMDRRAQALAAIPDIESLGVRLLVDDFGVAISSFSTIKRLPRLTAIKIDSSFIAGLGVSSEDSSGVAAIVGLAHGLKLVAIAEGVETAEQALTLRGLGCDRAQGFYFARPREPEAFGELLDSARYGELLA